VLPTAGTAKYTGGLSEYTHTHTHTHIRAHTHTHTCIHVYTYAYVRIYMYVRTYVYTCIHIRICMYVCIYVHTYIHTYIHTYTYMPRILAHTHTHKCTHTHTCTHAHVCAHAHTHIHLRTHSHTHTHNDRCAHIPAYPHLDACGQCRAQPAGLFFFVGLFYLYSWSLFFYNATGPYRVQPAGPSFSPAPTSYCCLLLPLPLPLPLALPFLHLPFALRWARTAPHTCIHLWRLLKRSSFGRMLAESVHAHVHTRTHLHVTMYGCVNVCVCARARVPACTCGRMHTHCDECVGQRGQVVEDSIALARIEGLEGHARAAEIRRLN